MDRGDGPFSAYAALIGRLSLGQPVGQAEIERLPDPDLFRDALFLVRRGTFSPRDLDETDALLVDLIRKIDNVKRG